MTNTKNHYVSFDRFHQGNTSSTSEQLRHLDIVPQRHAINSQVVEEFFSVMQRNCHFLTQMTPGHHIFVVCLLCHFTNLQRNGHRISTIEKNIKNADMPCFVEKSYGGRMQMSASPCMKMLNCLLYITQGHHLHEVSIAV